MTDRDDDWSPDPPLLSAYADGELCGRPELDALRLRIEAWLGSHPEARAELADYRQLHELWKQTTPPDPAGPAWATIEARLHAASAPRPRKRLAVGHAVAGILATAASIALLLWWSIGSRTPPQELEPPAKGPAPAPFADVEVLPVATASEITILRVEGADTSTVVVGILPVHGPLLLAGPGDVVLNSVQPDARDQMVPHVRIGGSERPMIWAPLLAESKVP